MADFDFSKLTVGMANLVDGYIDYAQEVIVKRALPAYNDGLKVVNRRILYTLYKMAKRGEKIKCSDLAGATMRLHPHGDASIYSAMTLLTDRNHSMELPVLQGQGNFGDVRLSDPPAAPRYTEVMLHPNTSEYFKDINGINLIPSFDSKNKEPDFLPVTYPAVLCNAQKGIAVGFACNIPSFNFNDVLDLTIEYIRDGKCSTVICPDFVTGGYYVRNNKELDKLMKTGKAKLKLRGKVTKVGSEATIVEFPYGVEVGTLLNQIKRANMDSIREFGDTTDFEKGVSILLDCKKNRVDEAITSLYRDTDLQYIFPANLFTVVDGKPLVLGVWDIIARWVDWRRGVVKKQLKFQLENMKSEIKESRAFMEVFKNKPVLEEFTRLVLKVGDKEAVQYLLDNLDNEIVTPELASWLTGRRMNVWRTGGKYAERYNTLSSSIKEWESYLGDIDAYIIRELETLKAEEGSKHPRRTEVTNTDYEFKAREDAVIKDDTWCYYTIKDGFFRKSRFASNANEFDHTLEASASDVLIAIDNRGRVLRIYCEDLPYSGASELGIYLPRYFGFEEGDDYKITYLGLLDGKTKMLIYKDGNVGFLDTNEWIGNNRRVKVIEDGIAASEANNLGAVLEDVPEWLFVTDTSGKIGYVTTDTIKRKKRNAKTRVFNLDKGSSLAYYIALSANDGALYLRNIARYVAPKLHFLEDENSILGDATLFVPMK